MATPARLKRPRKDGRPFNPGAKRYLLTRQKENIALQLRLEGLSYLQIAQKLQMTEVGAYSMIIRVLTKYEDDIKEKIPAARVIELKRCDELLKYVWPKVKKGDPKAIQAALKVAERRAKLSGLDMPTELLHKGTGEGDAIAIEVFRKMITDAGVENLVA